MASTPATSRTCTAGRSATALVRGASAGPFRGPTRGHYRAIRACTTGAFIPGPLPPAVTPAFLEVGFCWASAAATTTSSVGLVAAVTAGLSFLDVFRRTRVIRCFLASSTGAGTSASASTASPLSSPRRSRKRTRTPAASVAAATKMEARRP